MFFTISLSSEISCTSAAGGELTLLSSGCDSIGRCRNSPRSGLYFLCCQYASCLTAGGWAAASEATIFKPCNERAAHPGCARSCCCAGCGISSGTTIDSAIFTSDAFYQIRSRINTNVYLSVSKRDMLIPLVTCHHRTPDTRLPGRYL